MTSFGFDFSPLPKREESSSNTNSGYCNIKGTRTTTANIQLWKAPGCSTWSARPSTRENALAQQDLTERLNQIPLPVPVYSPTLMGTPKYHRRSSIFSALRRKTRWTNPRARWRSPPRSPVFLSGAATVIPAPPKTDWRIPEEEEKTTEGARPAGVITLWDHQEPGEKGCLNLDTDGICSDEGMGDVEEEDRPSSPYSGPTQCSSDCARMGEHQQAAGTTPPTFISADAIKHWDPQELRSREESSATCCVCDDSSSFYSRDVLDESDIREPNKPMVDDEDSESIYFGDSGDEAVVSSAFAMPVGPAINLGKARVLRARQISVRRCLGRYTSVPQAITKTTESPTEAPKDSRGPGIRTSRKRHQPASPDRTKLPHTKLYKPEDTPKSPELHRIAISNVDTDIDASSFYSQPEESITEPESISEIMRRRQSKNSAGETVGLQLLVSTLFEDSSDEEEIQQPPYVSEEELSPRQRPARRRPNHDHRNDHYNINRNSVISTSSSGVGSDIYSPTSRAPAPRKYSYTSTSTAPTAYSVHSLEVPSTANSAKRFSIVISEPGADGDDELSPRLPQTYDFPIPRKSSVAEMSVPDSRRSSTISYEDRGLASPRIPPKTAPRRAESRQSVRVSASRQSLREAEPRRSYEERTLVTSPSISAFPIPRKTESRQSIRSQASRQSIQTSKSHQSLRSSSRMEIESERRRSSTKHSPHQREEERELTRKISYLALHGNREQSEAIHTSDPEDEENIFDEYHKHLSMSTNRRPGPSIPLQLASSSKLARMLSPEPSPVIAAFPSQSRLRKASSSHPLKPSITSPTQPFQFPPTNSPPRALTKAEKLTGVSAAQLWPGPAPRRQRRRTASSDCIDAEIESNIRTNSHNLPPVPSLPNLPHISKRELAMSAPGPVVPSRKSSRHELTRKAPKQNHRPPPLSTLPPPPPPSQINVEFDLRHGREEGDMRKKGHERSISGETTRTRIAVNGFWDADSFGRMVLPGLPVDLVQAR